MLGTLIESNQQRSRSAGTVIGSLLVHAAGLLLLVNVARAVEQTAREPRELPDTLWFTPIDPLEPSAIDKSGSSGGSTDQGPGPVVPTFDGTIPTEIPQPATSALDDLESLLPGVGDELKGMTSGPAGDERTGTGATSEPREFAIAEEPVRQTGGATPHYPDRLRASGLEGRVLARFVVDTSGRVEPGSLIIISSDHELFVRAIREALPRMRFQPARASGRSVRAVAEQEYVFELRR